MYTEERRVLFFDSMQEGAENENNEDEMFKTYDHPLHKEYMSKGIKGSHSGMDWLLIRAFVEA